MSGARLEEGLHGVQQVDRPRPATLPRREQAAGQGGGKGGQGARQGQGGQDPEEEEHQRDPDQREVCVQEGIQKRKVVNIKIKKKRINELLLTNV